MWLRQSTAGQEILLGPFLLNTDGDTAQTGLTIANTDIKIWKEGGTTEANKNSGGATHIASGRYYAVLDATDTNTLGKLEVNVHVSTALAVRREFMVLPANVYDSLVLGTDVLDVNTTQVGGTTQTANDMSGDVDTLLTRIVGTLAAGTHNPQTGDAYAIVNNVSYGNAQLVRATTPANTLDISATGEAGIDWNNIGTPTATVNLSGTTVGTLTANSDKTGYSISGTKTTLDALNDITTANVNTEVSDVLKTDTIAEQAQGIPPTTPTFEEAVMYLYMALTKSVDVDATLKEFYNNAGVVVWKKGLSDDGTNFTEAKGASGP